MVVEQVAGLEGAEIDEDLADEQADDESEAQGDEEESCKSKTDPDKRRR
jgi:hypothetical protein